MAFEKYYNAPERVTAPACVHLRSKAMYVTGNSDPEHPDEAGGRYCWCNQTQNVLGPDNAHVDRPACIAGRACYRATY